MLRPLLPIAAAAAIAGEAAPPQPGWVLTFADEFDRPGRPDPAKWTFEEGFKRNQELQWYLGENAVVDSGNLVLEARRVQVPNPRFDPKAPKEDWRRSRRTVEYTSASAWTKHTFAWRYGRMEVRARFTAAAGLWPAIWTLGITGEWPFNGEVDVFEYYKDTVLANLAWGHPNRGEATWRDVRTPIRELGGPGWDQAFHTWTMDWSPERIELALDGRVLNRTSLAETRNPDRGASSGIDNPFHQPHFILLNLAIGGNNGGDPAKTPFPSRYLIDHVRIWQPPEVLRVSATAAAAAATAAPLAVDLRRKP